MEKRRLEYVGYLPYLKNDLKVSSHPQFKHLAHPPDNYRFQSEVPWDECPNPLTKSWPAESRWVKFEKMVQRGGLGRASAKLISSIATLAYRSYQSGADLREIGRFLSHRLPSIPGQILIPADADMAFVPSFPVLFGQVPWVIEIEDTTTLFYPFVHNGWSDAKTPEEIPCFRVIKTMIESDRCRGIITHVHSTAESIPKLFSNPELAEKVFYVPLGIPELPARPARPATKKVFNLLFTNSWHQNSFSFYSRGGLDLLHAYQTLKTKYPFLTLTLRTQLPKDLPERYRWLIDNYDVRVLSDFLPEAEHDALIADTDAFVLPSARLHVVSILEMMGRGIPVVVSDGWGIEEYVEDGYNGLIVRGRYGQCTWIDEKNGLLREDYSSLLESNPDFANALTDKLSALIENADLRATISVNGIRDVRERHSVAGMNAALKRALDQAFGPDSADLRDSPTP